MLTFRFKKVAKSFLMPRIASLSLSGLFVVLVISASGFPAIGQDFGSPQPQQVLPSPEIVPSPQVTPAVQGSPFEQVVPSQAPPRITAKPVINSKSAEVVGATFIAIDSRLKQVFRGSVPNSLAELRAMDEQQAKVAAVIDQVTVNVQQGSAQGSGVIISSDGYILTAAHVAGKPGRRASVHFSYGDGTPVEAITLGMDRNNDAGLIKITKTPSTPWPHATIGESEKLKEGQWCIAAGHPGGWQPKRGSVIRVGRILSIKGRDPANTLFTDCTLIGGDSGGPLFTLEGELIGIHSRIGTEMEDNMHVPIEVYKNGWKDLKASKAWGVLPGFKPMIGVHGDPATPDAIVGKVVPDSPAKTAGLEAGDRIRSFDGVKVNTFAELQAAVEQTLPGDTVFVEIVRNGASLRFPLVVGIEGD
jgi:S1-C subfamily serine protease